MDRLIDNKELNKKRKRQYVKYTLTALVVITAITLFNRLLQTSADAKQLRIETVQKGNIENTITATGIVVAAFEEQVNAPVATTIKQVLKPIGEAVKAQDIILSLDAEYVQLELNSKKDQLALRKNNVELLKLEFERDLEDLDYNAQIKALELNTAEAQLVDAKRLLKVGGVTQEEVERAELNVKIKQLEKEKLANELDYRKSSLEGRRKNLNLEVNIQEKEVAQLSRKLRETVVRAPRAGVVTWVNENIGQQVTEGTPLARIADLGHFRLEGSCSDRFTPQISVGLVVHIKIGKAKLQGRVSSILPEVENNTLRFLVSFEDASHPALRPNLRTEFDIVIGAQNDVLRVKNGAAFKGGKKQDIFVIRDGKAVKTQIELGMRSSEWIEIQSGLKPGDKIIVSDTEDYEHLDHFSIEK